MADRIKLLIVDDEVRFLDTLCRRLEIRDFQVTLARNRTEAVTAADKQQFDLAILNINLPGIIEDEVVERLQQHHKYLEIIIITGHDYSESTVENTKLGVFGYLPKPYKVEKLVEILKDAYENRLIKKFKLDPAKMNTITNISTNDSPLVIMRKLRELDDDVK